MEILKDERQKIVITDKIADKMNGSALSPDEVLEQEYREELAKRREENPSVRDVSPMRMAIADAGFTGKSTVKDIITTPGTSEWLLPAYIDERLREVVLSDDILQYIVGSTVGVDGLAVTAHTFDLGEENNFNNTKMVRVSEGADLPIAEIKIGENSIRLTKKGRAVEATYEAMMYMKLEMLSRSIQAIGNSVAYHNVGEALDVIVKGDGNKNPVDTVLTTATKDVITNTELLNGILAFHEKTYGLPVTTIVCGQPFFGQIATLFNSTESVRGIWGFNVKLPQFSDGPINVVFDSRVPKVGGANAILLLNNDFALTKYIANGSQIREMANNIRNQTRLGTISEISGFAKYMKNASAAIVSKA